MFPHRSATPTVSGRTASTVEKVLLRIESSTLKGSTGRGEGPCTGLKTETLLSGAHGTSLHRLCPSSSGGLDLCV